MQIDAFFHSLAAILGVVLVVSLGACGKKEAGVGQTEGGQLVLGEAEQTTTVERGVDLAGRTLVLDGFRGSISLTGVDVDGVSLVFTKQARGRTDKAAADLLERVTIQETGDAQTFTYTLRSKEPTLSQVAVQGLIPRTAALHVRLESGDVALSAIDGPIEVNLEGGAVAIGGAGASVTVETRNGAIDLGLYRVPAGAIVNLRTTNGDLALTLPGSVDARVEAQTGSGEITTEGLTFSNQRLNPEGAGARFQGALGRGGASVALRTENGAIRLQEGSVRRLSPRETAPEPAPDSTGAAADSLASPAAPDTLHAPDTLRAPDTL